MHISLRYKIFLSILLANLLVASAIVFINNRAFDSSFNAYLEQVQSRRMAPLLSILSELYADQGSWDWVSQEPRRWYRLVHNATPGRQPRDHRFEAVLLRDANEHLLFGEVRLLDRTQWWPIEYEGETVGSLGVPRSQRLGAEFDALFASQQRNQLRWIALITLLVSAALAIPFASHLLKPIARLKTAFHRLASGDFGPVEGAHRLRVSGKDELADLARDFNVLADTLQQNQQSRQRWIVDIAHELRTPIAVLKAELEALLDGVRQPEPETMASLFEEIQRLDGLVSDLHDLSLSDTGTLAYRKTEVDLVSIIEKVHGHFDLELARRHLGWSLCTPQATVTLQGDANRLVQMFSNLMQNSLNYTDGSLDHPGRIQVGIELTEEDVRVTWADSSPGVPAESLPLLFDRLYRVEASRNRATGGSGLGLSIVKSIAGAHSGLVTAHASELGGLEIRVIFSGGHDNRQSE